MKITSSFNKISSNLLTSFALSVTTGISLTAGAAQALTFNFNSTPGTDPRAIAGFAAAGNLWSSLLTDDVTLNIDIGFESLEPGVLGEASSAQDLYSYTSVYNALLNDRTSADDFTAVSNLPSGSAFNMLLNRTSNNPNGFGSPRTYLDKDGDANNTNIFMSNGNAKALGLLAGDNTASDALIMFSNLLTWDFDRSDGISAEALDFVSTAAHEIGHTLGFISGVDVLDLNSTEMFYTDDQFSFVSTMDLFRFSQSSIANGRGVIDWAANTTDKYFSINGGIKKIASFSTGQLYGDQQQASHWKDDLGIGIMDPTAAAGELLEISQQDQQLLDVIGWNRTTPEPPSPTPTISPSSISTSITPPSNSLTTTSVPEPSTLLGMMALGAGLLLKRNKHQ